MLSLSVCIAFSFSTLSFIVKNFTLTEALYINYFTGCWFDVLRFYLSHHQTHSKSSLLSPLLFVRSPTATHFILSSLVHVALYKDSQCLCRLLNMDIHFPTLFVKWTNYFSIEAPLSFSLLGSGPSNILRWAWCLGPLMSHCLTFQLCSYSTCSWILWAFCLSM